MKVFQTSFRAIFGLLAYVNRTTPMGMREYDVKKSEMPFSAQYKNRRTRCLVVLVRAPMREPDLVILNIAIGLQTKINPIRRAMYQIGYYFWHSYIYSTIMLQDIIYLLDSRLSTCRML